MSPDRGSYTLTPAIKNWTKIVIGLLLWIPGLGCVQELSSRPQASVSTRLAVEMNEQSLEILINAIEFSSPGEYFSVTIVFDSYVDLHAIREVVNLLEMPRVLAYVEYGSLKRAVGLGTFYDEGSWQKGICQVRVSDSLGRTNFLKNIPPEKWPVRELHAYGSAYALRELTSGTVLPPARITDGSAQDRRHERAFAKAIKSEIARKMQLPANFPVPAECEQYAQPVDAPILSGMPIYLSQSERDLDPDTLLRAQLGGRSLVTPVTLMLHFNESQTVESLAELVERYQIEGLSAEFSPRATDRILTTAQLSIYGSSLENQIQRTHCSMKLGDGLGNTYDVGEWYSVRAQVSLSVSRAWELASDQTLQSARLESDFPVGELSRLREYYLRLATQVTRMPPGYIIPAGCEQYIQHSE